MSISSGVSIDAKVTELAEGAEGASFGHQTRLEDPKIIEMLRKRIRSGALFSEEQNPHTEKVVIYFPGYAKNFLQERPFHQSMKIKELECGDLHVTMNVAVNDMLKQWVMYYGPIAEVLKPAKLRQMLLDSAKDLVKLYEK